MKNQNYLKTNFSEKYLDLRRKNYVTSAEHDTTKNITIYVYYFVLMG